MSKVFADTFYFLALLNKRDEAHEKAVEYAAIVEKIVTTEWVLTELADGLASPVIGTCSWKPATN